MKVYVLMGTDMCGDRDYVMIYKHRECAEKALCLFKSDEGRRYEEYYINEETVWEKDEKETFGDSGVG